MRRLDGQGVGAFLVTAIDRDGTLAGPDLRLLAAVRAATTGTLLASGGIGSADDVRRVAEAGCDGVVIGRALLAGTLELADALARCGARRISAARERGRYTGASDERSRGRFPAFPVDQSTPGVMPCAPVAPMATLDRIPRRRLVLGILVLAALGLLTGVLP